MHYKQWKKKSRNNFLCYLYLHSIHPCFSCNVIFRKKTGLTAAVSNAHNILGIIITHLFPFCAQHTISNCGQLSLPGKGHISLLIWTFIGGEEGEREKSDWSLTQGILVTLRFLLGGYWIDFVFHGTWFCAWLYCQVPLLINSRKTKRTHSTLVLLPILTPACQPFDLDLWPWAVTSDLEQWHLTLSSNMIHNKTTSKTSKT